jgi:hypothetical protein
VAVPDSILNSSGAVVVTGKRFFVRAPNGHYVETVGYIDLTGDALAAGKSDVAYADADVKAELVKARAELADAHKIMLAIDEHANGIPAAIVADADSWFVRVERLLGFKPSASVAAKVSK